MGEHWTYSLFFCLAELWGAVVISVLSWSLANEVCTVDEAKTVYPLVGIAANCALVLAGNVMKYVNRVVAKAGPDPLKPLLLPVLGTHGVVRWRQLQWGALHRSAHTRPSLGQASLLLHGWHTTSAMPAAAAQPQARALSGWQKALWGKGGWGGRGALTLTSDAGAGAAPAGAAAAGGGHRLLNRCPAADQGGGGRGHPTAAPQAEGPGQAQEEALRQPEGEPAGAPARSWPHGGLCWHAR